MERMIATWGLIGAGLWLWMIWVVWRFVSTTPLELRRIAAALESLVDLQRTQRDLSAPTADDVKKDEGSSDTQARRVSQIESYGDLSKVGLLKKPKI